MKILSIILPVYNEEDTILSILQRIENTKSNNIVYEVIVINDGSSDNTSKILKDNKSLYKYLINKDKNMGKGFSVKEGLKLATGEYIIFQDADLEYDPLEIEKFINVINNFNPDVVLGSRFSYDKYIRSYNLLNKIANIIKKLPTIIENIEKKYRPKIPHSLNIPKLTPVFLTKTIFKNGNSCISSKLLCNIILEIKILKH